MPGVLGGRVKMHLDKKVKMRPDTPHLGLHIKGHDAKVPVHWQLFWQFVGVSELIQEWML